MPGTTYNARRVFRGMVIEKTPADLVASRAAKAPAVETTDAVPEIAEDDAVPAGVAGKIVRTINRLDAQGRGCSGCKAARKMARKMIMKVARPP